jgi:hypothetical protein
MAARHAAYFVRRGFVQSCCATSTRLAIQARPLAAGQQRCNRLPVDALSPSKQHPVHPNPCPLCLQSSGRAGGAPVRSLAHTALPQLVHHGLL